MNLVIEQIKHLKELKKCKCCKLLFCEDDGLECGNCGDFYCNECLFNDIDLGYTEQTLHNNGYCETCMDLFDNETDDEYKSNNEEVDDFLIDFFNDTGIEVILEQEEKDDFDSYLSQGYSLDDISQIQLRLEQKNDSDYLDYIDYPDTDDLIEILPINKDEKTKKKMI